MLNTNLRSSFKIFVDSYPKEKSAVNYSNIWRWLVINPISIILAYLFSLIRIQPNFVTLLSLIIGMFSIYKFYIGAFLSGAILINVAYLFDCIDGHLARYYKKTSKSGQFFDDVVGIIIWSFCWISIGFGLYFNSDTILEEVLNYYQITEFDRIYYVLLGVIAGYMSELRTLIGFKFTQANIANNELKRNINELNKYQNHGFFYILLRNLLGIGGLMAPILLLSAFLNFLSITLFIYALVFLLVFIFYCFRYYFKLNRK